MRKGIWTILHSVVTSPTSECIVSNFQKLCGVRGKHRNAAVDAYFRLASACGDEIFSLIPMLFWLTPEVSLAYITNFGIILTTGQVVKDLLKLPRPHGTNSAYEIQKLEAHYGTEYGMPSTHTMAGFVPLTVFLRLHKRGYDIPHGVWIACGICIISVALSRLYMGVHSVFDLVSGAFLAATCVGIINFGGDELDDILYKYEESGFLWLTLVLFFVRYYPSTKPWSASTSTACQIFGLWAGLGSASWFAHVLLPDCFRVFLDYSLLSAFFEHTDINWINALARLLIAALIVLVVKSVSKRLLDSLFIWIFENYGRSGYPIALMQDSLGNAVPVNKLYPIEIPVRYILSNILVFVLYFTVFMLYIFFISDC